MAVGETILGLNGTIGSELHRRVADDGTESVGFRLVSTERRFDKERGEWVDGRRCVIWVTCWRRLAANVCASLHKGDSVLVTGRLYTREQDAGDVLHQSVELDAFAVGPNLARGAVQLRRRRDPGPGRAQLPAVA